MGRQSAVSRCSRLGYALGRGGAGAPQEPFSDDPGLAHLPLVGSRQSDPLHTEAFAPRPIFLPPGGWSSVAIGCSPARVNSRAFRSERGSSLEKIFRLFFERTAGLLTRFSRIIFGSLRVAPNDCKFPNICIPFYCIKLMLMPYSQASHGCRLKTNRKLLCPNCDFLFYCTREGDLGLSLGRFRSRLHRAVANLKSRPVVVTGWLYARRGVI